LIDSTKDAASPLLDVHGLTVELRTHSGVLRPVRSVDLTVRRGETHAIVGESGCGKSLTALALLGLLPSNGAVSADQIDLAGESLLRITEKRWRQLRGSRIAMIFQDPMTSLDPCYRIGDQMIEILRQHKTMSRPAARQRALDLAAKVGIPSPSDRLDQYPHQLSGGLRQRVMIAMALLCEPDIILADEPTTALDVTIQAQVLQLLNQVKEETGVGILLITHDLGVVANTADRVSVMYGGQIVETGPTDEILRRPQHPYTEGLLQAIPIPGKTLRGGKLGFIPGVVSPPSGELTQCGFLKRCPYGSDACRTPVAIRSGGADRSVRCVLPDGDHRDAQSWTNFKELT
jgi:peptide/nickel transport system ATP-binding protein